MSIAIELDLLFLNNCFNHTYERRESSKAAAACFPGGARNAACRDRRDKAGGRRPAAVQELQSDRPPVTAPTAVCSGARLRRLDIGDERNAMH
ncbi:MAG: hypothetical protein J4G16_07585 [Acidobacteria bacterium]|nr:hypothetical protein [Acidobacteriota bacterium]